MQSVVIAITAKSQGVDQQLAKTKNKMDKLNQSILPQSANKNVNRIKQSLSGLGKMGDTVGGQLGRVASGLTSLLNPIGLITAGIGAAITLGVKLYQSLTMSHEEYMQYMQDKLNASNARLAKLDKTQKEDNGYFQRLQQLNKVESLSNAIKTQAITIIAILTQRYGDLGLSIDETTGKILGLDEAFKKISDRNQKLKLNELKNQNEISKMKASEAFTNTSGWTNPFTWRDKLKGRFHTTIGTDVYSSDDFITGRSFISDSNVWKELNSMFKGSLGIYIKNRYKAMKNGDYKSFFVPSSDEIKQIHPMIQFSQWSQKLWNNPLQNLSEQQKKLLYDIEKQIKVYKDKKSNKKEDVEQLNRLNEKLKITKEMLALQVQIKVAREAAQQAKTNESEWQKWKTLQTEMVNYYNQLQKYNAESEKINGGQTRRLEKTKKLTQETLIIIQKINQLYRTLQSSSNKKTQILSAYSFGNKDKGQKYLKLGEQIEDKYSMRKIIEENNVQLNKTLKTLTDERDELNKLAEKSQLIASQFDRLMELNKQIANLEKQIAQGKAKSAELDAEITKLLVQRQSIVDGLTKQHDMAVKILDEELQLQQKRSSMTEKEIQKQRILNRLRRQGYDKIPNVDIEQMAEDEAEKTIKLRKEKAFRAISDSQIDEEMDLESTLNGEYKELARRRWEREIKAKGINSDDKAEYETIRSARAKINSLKIANNFKDTLDQMAFALQPNRKEAVKQRRIRDYELKYGFDFDDDKKAKLGQIVDLEFQMEKLRNQSINLSQYEVKTNQLTRRGGFAQGAVVISKTDQINSQIKNKAEQQVNLLKQIKDLIADVSKI